jgi:hypothetical protein
MASTVYLNDTEYEVTRARLRVWLQLEDIREQIARTADSKDRDGFVASIYSYLSVALSVDIDFSFMPWYEIVDAYMEIVLLHRPSFKFPFLTTAEKSEKAPWDYEGRTWFHWSHMLANAYGWVVEYIAELDIDEAIAHLQEITTSDQMRKEWEWMLSRYSVSYDKRGKGTFHDLKRPDWMKMVKLQGKQKLGDKVFMKESMIPMGKVVSWKDFDDEQLDA